MFIRHWIQGINSNIIFSFNTLFLKKDSHILKNKHLLYGSQQSLMTCLRTGKLKMSELNSYSDEKMTDLCTQLEFEGLSRYMAQLSPSLFSIISLCFSLPSASAKRLEVMKLYDSITTGVSQCHNTGNEKESSGIYSPHPPKNIMLIILF